LISSPQIYHEDKGYDDRALVFLSPQAPSLAVRRVLLTHPHSSKMIYLQGSPFRRLVGCWKRGWGLCTRTTRTRWTEDGARCQAMEGQWPPPAVHLPAGLCDPIWSISHKGTLSAPRCPAKAHPTPPHPTPPHPTPPHPTPPHPTPPGPGAHTGRVRRSSVYHRGQARARARGGGSAAHARAAVCGPVPCGVCLHLGSLGRAVERS
jgi:hypothetical protein